MFCSLCIQKTKQRRRALPTKDQVFNTIFNQLVVSSFLSQNISHSSTVSVSSRPSSSPQRYQKLVKMNVEILEDEIENFAFNLSDALKRANLAQDDLRKLRKLSENDEDVPKNLKDWFVSIIYKVHMHLKTQVCDSSNSVLCVPCWRFDGGGV